MLYTKIKIGFSSIPTKEKADKKDTKAKEETEPLTKPETNSQPIQPQPQTPKIKY